MACLPLIERELRVALRKQQPARGRLKVAALAVAGSMLFLLFGALTGSHTQGRTLEQILCLAGLYFVIRAPGLTAGVLAEERRNQTLGLLFLSGLSAGEVFISKFLSAALMAFTNLLALFPMLALPFLIGGVSFELFLATSCGLPMLMLFALAVSLLASALTREDGAAGVLASVLGVLLCALTPAIYLAQSYFSPGTKPSLWWLQLSPAYGPWLVWHGLRTGFRAGEQAAFWQNFGITLSWSLLALGTAAYALKLLWRQQQAEEHRTGWWSRWHTWLHGSRAKRERLRSAWLVVNPFTWLAARDCQPAALGWLVVGGVVTVWLLCWAAWPARWLSLPNFFVTAIVLNSALAWLIRLTAAQIIGQGRQDGAYEFLLTTPLSPKQIVQGTQKALQYQFGNLAWFVLGVNLLMMVGGLQIRSWSPRALIGYYGAWLVLLLWSWDLGHRWSRALPVMWASLNCGRPVHAVWRTKGVNGWSWLWIFFNVQYVARNFWTFPTGAVGEFILVGAVLFFALLHALYWRTEERIAEQENSQWDPNAKAWLRKDPVLWCERRLVREFRHIVREPLPDPTDPRFKKWNPTERFPWSAGKL